MGASLVKRAIASVRRKPAAKPKASTALQIKPRPDEQVAVQERPKQAGTPHKVLRCAGQAGPWCPAMERYLHDEANAQRPGMALLVLFNLNKGTERVAGVYYKKQASDPGVMLNFCPWCGAKIG